MNFHGDPVYGGDLHQADMAWAKHAAGCGMTLEQIKDELARRSTGSLLDALKRWLGRSEISHRLHISRTFVRRFLGQAERRPTRTAP